MKLLFLLVVAALAVPASPAQAASSSDVTAAACAPPRSDAPRPPRAEDDAIPPENDWDCDEIPNETDNCTTVRNNDQSDVDGDGFGDRCDDDADGDGIPNAQDSCWLVNDPTNNPEVCNVDSDGDGVMDRTDNCRRLLNPDQKDTDGDTYGDVCDGDDDDDYDLDPADNCPLTPNPDQGDADADKVGDACDPSTTIVTPPSRTADATPEADRRAPTLTVRSSRVRRHSDAAGGMPLWVRCSEACAVTAEVTVSARDARRLKINRGARKAFVVASGEAAVDAAGSTYVFFDVIRAAQRRLFGSRSVRATLRVRAVDAAGNRTATTARSLVFRR